MTGPKIARSSLIAIVIGATAALAVPLTQMPVQATEAWEQLLGMQLQDEKKCVLSGTIFVREMPGPEGVVMSGRAKCFDGREFDFSQAKPHMKFEIRACEPTVC